MLHALSNRVLFAGAVGFVMCLCLLPFLGKGEPKAAPALPVRGSSPWGDRPPTPREEAWQRKVGDVAWRWGSVSGRICWLISDEAGARDSYSIISRHQQKRGGKWFVGPYAVEVMDQAGEVYISEGPWLPLECDGRGKPSSVSLQYERSASARTTNWRCRAKGGHISPLVTKGGKPYDPSNNAPCCVSVWIAHKLAALWVPPPSGG